MIIRKALILLTVLIGFTACSKDDDSNSIVGTWESVSHYLKETVDGQIKESTHPHTKDTDKHTLTLNDDQRGTFRVYYTETKRWVALHFNYQIIGDKLIILVKDEGADRDLEFTYVLHQNELIVTEKVEDVEVRTSYIRK